MVSNLAVIIVLSCVWRVAQPQTTVNDTAAVNYIDEIYLEAGIRRHGSPDNVWDLKRCLMFNVDSDTNEWTFILQNWPLHDDSGYTQYPVANLWTDECKILKNSQLSDADNAVNPLEEFKMNVTEVIMTSNNISGLGSEYLCQFPKLEKLDLTENGLSLVDQIGLLDSCKSKTGCGSNLKRLILSGNPLETIYRDSFCQLDQLAVLTLANCGITTVEDGAFANLKKLQILNLSFNRLTNLTIDLFEDNLELRVLKLRNNGLHSVPNIGQLHQLIDFDLRSNSIVSITKTDFINATNLKSVHLQNNLISSIESGAFDNVDDLHYLSLTANRIQKLDQTFINSNIKKLFLKDNQLTEFSYGEISTHIRALDLTNNTISNINSSEVLQLDSDEDNKIRLKIQYISLNSNNLSNLDDLYLPKSLKYFYAKNNKIDKISFHQTYRSLIEDETSELIHINLENNKFTNVPWDLRVVQSRNTTTDGPYYYFNGNPLQCTCELTGLERFVVDLNVTFCTSNVKGVEQRSKVLSSELLCESSSDQNNRCQFNHSADEEPFDCEFQCPTACNCYTNWNFSIFHLHCSNANLTTVPDDFDHEKLSMVSEATLRLDGNDLANVSSDQYSIFTNVVSIYLNSSNVKFIDELAFANLSTLRKLHLEDNSIESLPSSLFDDLEQLEELYLSGNYITNLDIDSFLLVPSLKTLQLHDNDLSDAAIWELAQLEELKQLTVHDNPWTCECKFFNQMDKYLKNHTDVVVNALSLNCTEQDDTWHQMADYDRCLFTDDYEGNVN